MNPRPRKPPTPKTATGRDGEAAVERLLAGKGWTIRDRNWRDGAFELDLVCEDGETVVFVEVRTRDARGMVRGAETVNLAKRKKLVKAATLYLSGHDLWERPCRFDVAAVTRFPDHDDIELIENAFDATGSSWQPW